jgi:hypothetical protein
LMKSPPSVTPYPTRNIFPQDSSNLSKKGSKQVGVAKKRKRIESVTLNC